jgi:hypothetical protein
MPQPMARAAASAQRDAKRRWRGGRAWKRNSSPPFARISSTRSRRSSSDQSAKARDLCDERRERRERIRLVLGHALRSVAPRARATAAWPLSRPRRDRRRMRCRSSRHEFAQCARFDFGRRIEAELDVASR